MPRWLDVEVDLGIGSGIAGNDRSGGRAGEGCLEEGDGIVRDDLLDAVRRSQPQVSKPAWRLAGLVGEIGMARTGDRHDDAAKAPATVHRRIVVALVEYGGVAPAGVARD